MSPRSRVSRLEVANKARKFASMTGRRGFTNRDEDDVARVEGGFTVPLAFDLAPLPFAAPAPDPPLLGVVEGVVETLVENRARAWEVGMGSEAHGLGFVHLSVVLMIRVEQVVVGMAARPQALGPGEPVGAFALVDRWQHLVDAPPVRDSRSP